MESLANKYRPTTFDEIVGQDSIVAILKRQLELNQFKNCYLFCGPSGCGKTTLARVFANSINNGEGVPIEIDAASNNGVDNVKQIVADASERSLFGKYKIYIIDEVHALTSQAWQAFLKCIEEPPMYTIFMFATTESNKVPDTIVNRCMRFDIQKVSSEKIAQRLNFICNSEGFTNYSETTDLISKTCKNQCRDAISMLDKVAAYSPNFSIEKTMEILGVTEYDTYFKMINLLIDGNQQGVMRSVIDLYANGADFKQFVSQFLRFCLDVLNYVLLGDISNTSIPLTYKEMLDKSVNFESPDNYYNYVIDRLNKLKSDLKGDTDIMPTTMVALLQICRLV